MNPRSFREYDIRGVADRDLDDETVRAIGIAVGIAAQGDGVYPKSQLPDVVVGRDCRLSSFRLFEALVDGLGWYANVLDIGVVPTPAVYFAAQHAAVKPAASVMITGSHNPAEDNGFKIMVGSETLHGKAIADLRDTVQKLIADRAAERMSVTPGRPRGTLNAFWIDRAYLDYAASKIRSGVRTCKVVVDAGNGSGGPFAIQLYRSLGHDVIPLYCDFDGRFPNHHPDPTQPENLADLIEAVKREGAELGIALDGDADRVGVVDARGRILWGDQLMILLGRAVLDEIPGAKFVGEVKCSQTMYDELAKAGGDVEMWKVGHSLIKARMKETGAQLAGEMSGHMFFAHRWLGFDDGIYAGARVLELICRQFTTLATLVDDLPIAINTPEIRIDCPDDRKFDVVASVRERLRADVRVTNVVDIDGVRARFENGWGLVRASNTQPALVMRCEADTKERLAEIGDIMQAHIAHAQRS